MSTAGPVVEAMSTAGHVSYAVVFSEAYNATYAATCEYSAIEAYAATIVPSATWAATIRASRDALGEATL